MPVARAVLFVALTGAPACLAAQAPAAAPPPASAPIRRISVGETVTAALSERDSLYPDNTYFAIYQFTPTQDTITIDLESDEFDPVLIIRGDDLAASIINDDGGPGCAARVSQTFRSRGPYQILVNTTSSPERQTGRFTLSVSRGPKPVQARDENDCVPPQPVAGGAAT
ncbi:MAG: hypothetical protein ACREMN_10925, partial [Gemmatimonadales bacterium]